MDYYAMQVKTRAEERYIKFFRNFNFNTDLHLFFPKRELDCRKGGHTERKILPVFPGYVFAGFDDGEKAPAYLDALRRIDGFFRFLPSNRNILPLSGRDLQIALHFINCARDIAGISKVFFNENDKIVVLNGPLKGLEGNIVKADRRKGRAKVRLNFYKQSFLVDFGFESIERG